MLSYARDRWRADVHPDLNRTLFKDLPACPQGQRGLFAGLPASPGLHAKLRNAIPAFHGLERSLAPTATVMPDRVRLAAWNLERCVDPAGAAGLLAAQQVDVTMLTEMDVGMARTGQRHTPRTIAGPLGHVCLYGVEFLELSLGSAREERLFDGQANALGFHGNALTSAYPLWDPVLIRFDDLSTWFPEDCDERRIGGRMALAAKVRTSRGLIVLVSVHLEVRVHSDIRAFHMARLLDALEDYAPGAPIVLGGDFNTDADAWSLGKGVIRGSAPWADIDARTAEPAVHEPLFDVLAARGFGWHGANAPGTTSRETPQSGPRQYPRLRLDWFFTRGLTTREARTVPAVDAAGCALSDHDLITVDVAIP